MKHKKNSGNYATTVDRSEVCFKGYIEDMERFPLLSKAEQMELLSIAHKGGKDGEEARQKLIECNMRIVVSVAMLFKQNGLDLNDLISEGNVGLIEAIDRYDISKGQKFSAYAVHWIRNKIINSIHAHGKMIFIPRKRREKNEPCDIESIDNFISDDDDATFNDAFIEEEETDNGLMVNSEQSDIKSVLSHILTDKEMAVVLALHGIGQQEQSKNELAITLGVCPERVRQIYETALNKIRNSELKNVLLR